jgi:hypothetical protein
LCIEKRDYPNKNINTSVEKINVFRSDIKKAFRISNVRFNSLNFYKLNIFKTEGHSDFWEDIHISVPEDYNDVEKIEIIESTFNKNLIISLNDLIELKSLNCNFQDFRINYWKISNVNFVKNTIIGNINWGFKNQIKAIDEFRFNNCEVKGSFELSDTDITNEIQIKGTSFRTSPSFFESNNISEGCQIDFNYTNLKNFIFQKINFDNFKFENIDINNAEFKNCKWQSFDKYFMERFKVLDEDYAKNDLEKLRIVKNIYSKLKSNFQSTNDYINSGKFYISEQEIKRLISLKKRSFFEYFLLSLHKQISVYGESLAKPLLFIIIITLLTSITYLFSGFYSGERLVSYNFVFDSDNFGQTLLDWSQSLILSLKNIVPFSISDDFFLKTKGTLKLSQFIELIQKLINVILLASFTESFIRYLKK